MLFLHDVHAAIGEHEIELDEAVRDVYAPTIADDDARLAWYLYSTHGAGDAYIVNVFTALRDGAAWERLSRRLRYGDLADWLLQVDRITYWSQSTLLVSTEWSPTAALDLDALPVGPADHDVRVYREDTLTGPGIEAVIAEPKAADDDVLACIAGFRPFFAPDGRGRRGDGAVPRGLGRRARRRVRDRHGMERLDRVAHTDPSGWCPRRDAHAAERAVVTLGMRMSRR